MDWVLVWEPEGHHFDFQSRHVLGLQPRSPVGGMWEVATHWCFSPCLSLSLPSLRVLKIFLLNFREAEALILMARCLGIPTFQRLWSRKSYDSQSKYKVKCMRWEAMTTDWLAQNCPLQQWLKSDMFWKDGTCSVGLIGITHPLPKSNDIIMHLFTTKYFYILIILFYTSMSTKFFQLYTALWRCPLSSTQ